MTFLSKTILIFLLAVLAFDGKAQQEKFKSVFVYNFTKYIEWPENRKEGDFVIYVFGNSEIIRHLEVVASKKKVGNQPIVVKKINSAADLGNCHLLFIPTSKSGEFQEIIQAAKEHNILTVTEKSGLAEQGSCINFYSSGGELKFEINKSFIENSGLEINPALLLLGKVIN